MLKSNGIMILYFYQPLFTDNRAYLNVLCEDHQ